MEDLINLINQLNSKYNELEDTLTLGMPYGEDEVVLEMELIKNWCDKAEEELRELLGYKDE